VACRVVSPGKDRGVGHKVPNSFSPPIRPDESEELVRMDCKVVLMRR
jgi:hypothetical protein